MSIEVGRPAQKEREAEKVWEEVFLEASKQSTDQGIPANRVEWSKGIEGLGRGKFRMNVKPMFLDQNKRVSLLISNLYRDRDHIEVCVAIAIWNKNAPTVFTVITSPVGVFTPLELNALQLGRYAAEVVKSGNSNTPFLPQGSEKPN